MQLQKHMCNFRPVEYRPRAMNGGGMPPPSGLCPASVGGVKWLLPHVVVRKSGHGKMNSPPHILLTCSQAAGVGWVGGGRGGVRCCRPHQFDPEGG